MTGISTIAVSTCTVQGQLLNHNQGGIHFETYIEAREIKQKEFPICVHAEEDCPSQERFIQELLALEGIEFEAGRATELWARATPSVYGRCR